MKKMILRMLKKLNLDPVANEDEIRELTDELNELERIEKETNKEPSALEKEVEALREKVKKAELEKELLVKKAKEDNSSPTDKVIREERERLAELKLKEKELELQNTLESLKKDQANVLEKLNKAEKTNRLLQEKNKITAMKIEKPYLAELLDKIELDGENVTEQTIADELRFVFKFNDEEKLKADYESRSNDKNPFANEKQIAENKNKKEKDLNVKIPEEIDGDKLDDNIDLIAEKIANDPSFMDNIYIDFE